MLNTVRLDHKYSNTNLMLSVPAFCPETIPAKNALINRVSSLLLAEGYCAMSDAFEESVAGNPLVEVVLQKAAQYVRINPVEHKPVSATDFTFDPSWQAMDRRLAELSNLSEFYHVDIHADPVAFATLLGFQHPETMELYGKKGAVAAFDHGCIFYDQEDRYFSIQTAPQYLWPVFYWATHMCIKANHTRMIRPRAAASVNPYTDSADNVWKDREEELSLYGLENIEGEAWENNWFLIPDMLKAITVDDQDSGPRQASNLVRILTN